MSTRTVRDRLCPASRLNAISNAAASLEHNLQPFGGVETKIVEGTWISRLSIKLPRIFVYQTVLHNLSFHCGQIISRAVTAFAQMSQDCNIVACRSGP